jgi:peptidoglycan/xylan/chitin deacetylase (PgdA/CDA1 family)
MTAAEIRELASRPGHAIGSHGEHHVALPFQTPDTIGRELTASRATLESLIGRSVPAFAYPYGVASADLAATVAAAGYRLAVTCERRTAGPESSALLLPRVEAAAWTGAAFESKLASFFEGA